MEFIKEDADLVNVLKDDGVHNVSKGTFENKSLVSLKEIKDFDDNWAARVVKNERFGAVLISQEPGNGNRLHYHPDADEFWFIVQGEWEWFIEGEGVHTASERDMIYVKKGVNHKITCIGEKCGIRLAITAADVNHVYIQ